ncbi:MAG TPA: A24 family peptidase [Solimonas sp.]
MCPLEVDPVLPVALGIWALVLAVDDIRHHRVLNVALVPVAAFALAARVSGGWPGCDLSLWSGLAGAAIGLAFWLPGYLLKRSGAGDVKCAMVMGLVLGGTRALEANLIGFIALGLLALIAMLAGRRNSRIAAVPALATGFIAALAGGPWLLGA